MGQQTVAQEQLFYSFNLDAQSPRITFYAASIASLT
jgi:hypothetical protein